MSPMPPVVICDRLTLFLVQGVILGRAVKIPNEAKWVVVVCEVKIDGVAVLPSERRGAMPGMIDALPTASPAAAAAPPPVPQGRGRSTVIDPAPPQDSQPPKP